VLFAGLHLLTFECFLIFAGIICLLAKQIAFGCICLSISLLSFAFILHTYAFASLHLLACYINWCLCICLLCYLFSYINRCLCICLLAYICPFTWFPLLSCFVYICACLLSIWCRYLFACIFLLAHLPFAYHFACLLMYLM
jgi:hypothetical protein